MTPLAQVPTSPNPRVQATKWLVAGPETTPGFSAVAYFFGAELRTHRKVTVGLIHTSWGGTPAQAWTSPEALNAEPSLKHYHEKLRELLAKFDLEKATEAYNKALDKWSEDAAKAKAAGKPAPRRPQPPTGPGKSPGSPSTLYNAMIAPLIPYGIQGAIWYQGEANAGDAYEYRTLFPTMITDWRTRWRQGDFPFLFVQLAPFQKPVDQPGESNWAELREAQLLTTTKLKNTAMAVITDAGEADIHPKNKKTVGERLAVAARSMVYGEKIAASGPNYQSMKVEANKIVLTFSSTAGGLEARGGELTGFAICGEDKKFVNAKAEIVGADRVAVSADGIDKPVAVRFGWAIYPVVNLWNREGLPASPFRTDDFPGVTQRK